MPFGLGPELPFGCRTKYLSLLSVDPNLTFLCARPMLAGVRK
ncbi:hypothetical protein BH10PLA2_BH10PLA2_31730 [soil metagenome]